MSSVTSSQQFFSPIHAAKFQIYTFHVYPPMKANFVHLYTLNDWIIYFYKPCLDSNSKQQENVNLEGV